MRAPHRDVLACRGLAQRGKLRTEHRALNFIARQGDNGIVWNILSFWRDPDDVEEITLDNGDVVRVYD